jgi:hypothetical protein
VYFNIYVESNATPGEEEVLVLAKKQDANNVQANLQSVENKAHYMNTVRKVVLLSAGLKVRT